MPAGPPRPPLNILVERLRDFYPADQATVLYEASSYAVCGPVVTRQALGRLASADVTPMATLVIPPVATGPPDPTMLARLGLTEP